MKQTTRHAVGKMDTFFMILIALTYLFGCFVHFLSAENTMQFIILFNILYLLVVITYFTGLVTSLICCLLYVFGYGSYILYEVMVVNTTIPATSYIWLIATPLFCIAVSFYRAYLTDVQDHLLEFEQKEDNLVGFDQTTNSLNEHMFHYDMARFIPMAKRGYIKLTLLVIRLRYYYEILRIIGDAGMERLYREIGLNIKTATRAEDIPYFTKDGKFILITITDKSGGAIVKNRVREGINMLYMEDQLKTYNLTIDVQIGIAEYDDTVTGALELIQRAEEDMEFDL